MSIETTAATINFITLLRRDPPHTCSPPAAGQQSLLPLNERPWPYSHKGLIAPTKVRSSIRWATPPVCRRLPFSPPPLSDPKDCGNLVERSHHRPATT